MAHNAYEAIIASEVPEAAIACMAHMSNADIAQAMERIRDHQSVADYALITGSWTQQDNAEQLHAYDRELVRRRVVADQERLDPPVNLLDAVNQFRKEAASIPVSQAVVADFISALVAASTSLDTVREGSEHQQAAE